MKSKKGYSFMAIGLCLLLVSLILTLYNRYDETRAETSAQSVLAQIDLSPTETTAHDEIPDYILNPNMDMPVQTIDGNEYIGVLKIPKIDLMLPVMSETDTAKLKISLCRYSGSVYLNNMVIAGHNYSKHLGDLSTLEKGDRIIFTDTDKNIFEYEVMYTDILGRTEGEKMVTADGWDLTIFTCTYDGRNRVTVRAKLAVSD